MYDMDRIIYISYAVIILLTIALVKQKYVISKLQVFAELFSQAMNDAKIIRDVSLGSFVNGMYSVMNTDNAFGFLGYLLLTLISLVGIINSNIKIEKDR